MAKITVIDGVECTEHVVRAIAEIVNFVKLVKKREQNDDVFIIIDSRGDIHFSCGDSEPIVEPAGDVAPVDLERMAEVQGRVTVLENQLNNAKHDLKDAYAIMNEAVKAEEHLENPTRRERKLATKATNAARKRYNAVDKRCAALWNKLKPLLDELTELAQAHAEGDQ